MTDVLAAIAAVASSLTLALVVRVMVLDWWQRRRAARALAGQVSLGEDQLPPRNRAERRDLERSRRRHNGRLQALPDERELAADRRRLG
jgi:hypothetical protein